MDIRFAYWVPNVSGGLVVSNIPQRTDWSYDYNARLAQTAEEVGFDYALAQARFIGSYGAEYQLEALTTVAALAPVTQRLKLIAAVHPGLRHLGVVAKSGATIDFLSGGRFCLISIPVSIPVSIPDRDSYRTAPDTTDRVTHSPSREAGASTRDRQGMWANSNFADLVEYNDGFKTGLIGTAEQVADKIRQYYEIGVDLILCGFLHYTDDLPALGRTVIPLVRQIKARRRTEDSLKNGGMPHVSEGGEVRRPPFSGIGHRA